MAKVTVSFLLPNRQYARDGQSTMALDAEVRDDADNPIPNTTVTWTTTNGSLEQASNRTDGLGVAGNILTTDYNFGATVNAQVTAAAAGAFGQKSVTFLAGDDAGGSLQRIAATYAIHPAEGGQEPTTFQPTSAQEAWIEARPGNYRSGNFAVRRRLQIAKVVDGTIVFDQEETTNSVMVTAGNNAGILPLVLLHEIYSTKNWGDVTVAPGTYKIISQCTIFDIDSGIPYAVTAVNTFTVS